MQNLPSSSDPFKSPASRRPKDLSNYVALGLVMRKIRRVQRRLLAQTPGRQITLNAGGRR